MTYTVKRERIEKRLREEAERVEAERIAEERRGAECRRILRRLIAVGLIAVAAAFGGLLAELPLIVSFLIVFVYLCAQLVLWMK